MKYLITGGCGFLGSNIAAHAIKEGHEVFIIDAMMRVGSNENRMWLESQATENQLKIAEIDVADTYAINSFFQKYGSFDNIAHLAAQVALTTSIADPHRDFLTNAVGTFNLLEATRLYSPDSVFIYSSTNKVYGEMQQICLKENETRYVAPEFIEGFDESLPLDFSSPYGCSKGAADQYVRDWYRNFGLKTIVFRHSSMYGGRQFSTFDQGWIGWFCLQALEQKQALNEKRKVKEFTIAGNGKQVRDILHVEDVVRLYNKAFENGSLCAGSIFNIGGGANNSLSLLELFEYLAKILGIKPKFTHTEWRPSDQKVFIADIKAVSNTLGWSPNLTAYQGIQNQIDWVSTKINSNHAIHGNSVQRRVHY